jgi:hypothetical protein
MTDLSSALAILSAMITPAVLISACGSLILATSQRLGRVMERARKVAERLRELGQHEGDPSASGEQALLVCVAFTERSAQSAICNWFGKVARKPQEL